ncbi:hypothetical protein [Zunongwangia sp. H14]|uniref:hypothetical protein n=1 Tax=Zunongwangia sp. H14 TaxID=3240792 RepID=UPI003561A1D2
MVFRITKKGRGSEGRAGVLMGKGRIQTGAGSGIKINTKIHFGGLKWKSITGNRRGVTSIMNEQNKSFINNLLLLLHLCPRLFKRKRFSLEERKGNGLRGVK